MNRITPLLFVAFLSFLFRQIKSIRMNRITPLLLVRIAQLFLVFSLDSFLTFIVWFTANAAPVTQDRTHTYIYTNRFTSKPMPRQWPKSEHIHTYIYTNGFTSKPMPRQWPTSEHIHTYIYTNGFTSKPMPRQWPKSEHIHTYIYTNGFTSKPMPRQWPKSEHTQTYTQTGLEQANYTRRINLANGNLWLFTDWQPHSNRFRHNLPIPSLSIIFVVAVSFVFRQYYGFQMSLWVSCIF